VIQYRRLSSVLLGMWLGAGILTDVAVTQNFQTVDRFLQTPGSVAVSAQLNDVGRARERLILRRNAGEENNWIFENWERVEVAMGGLLFLLLLFGDRPQKLLLALCLAMTAIVAAQHFFVTPRIIDLGRRIDDLPPADPAVSRFWMLHGVYSGLDILKMVVGFGFVARLVIKRKTDSHSSAARFNNALPSQVKAQ
jgi:hypothetical protein